MNPLCVRFGCLAAVLLLWSCSQPVDTRAPPLPPRAVAKSWEVRRQGSGPVLAEADMLVISGGGFITALRRQDGTVLWRRAALDATAVCANAESLIVSSDGTGGALVREALDLHAGTLLFRQDIGSGPPVANDAPLVTSDDLLISYQGLDLVCQYLHGSGVHRPGSICWRHTVGDVPHRILAALDARRCWSSNLETGRGAVIEERSGEVLAQLETIGGEAPYLDQDTIFARQGDLTITSDGITTGSENWRSATTVASVLATTSTAVFAINGRSQLVNIDRQTGKTRSIIGDWSCREGWRLSGDRLVLNVDDAGHRALAAVDCSTDGVLWLQSLPTAAVLLAQQPDVVDLCIGIHAPGLDATPGALWSFVLDSHGNATEVLPPEAEIRERFPDRWGVLETTDAMILRRPWTPITPAPDLVAVAVTNPSAPLDETVDDVYDRLQWYEAGAGSRVAMAFAGSSVVIIGEGASDLQVHVADGGSRFDSGGVTVSRSHVTEVVQVDIGNTGWYVEGKTTRIKDGTGSWVVRLAPPMHRDATVPLVMRLTSASMEADLPLWVPSSWRKIVLGQ